MEAAEKKLGRPFRIAPGAKVDLRATIDPRPCPECGGTVEWAATSRRTAKGLERYVFARCRKNQAHRWGFRAPHENGDVEVTHAPSLTAAIDAQLSELEEKKKKLEEMRALALKLSV